MAVLGGAWSLGAWLLVMILGGLFLGAGVHGLIKAGAEYQPGTASVLLNRPSVRRGDPTTSSRNLWSVSIGLHYRYQVDGRPYQGMGILDIGQSGSPSEADALAAAARQRYRAGAEVTIYIDRNDPARSTLDRPSWLKAIPVTAFGLLFVLFGLVSAGHNLLTWWRRQRHRDSWLKQIRR